LSMFVEVYLILKSSCHILQWAINCRTTCLKHFCCSKPMCTLTVNCKFVTSNIVYFVFQIQSRTSSLFCILDLSVEVFDKSISNTFLKSISYFKYFKKVSFTTLLTSTLQHCHVIRQTRLGPIICMQ